MNEEEKRNLLIKQAVRWLGKNEADGSHGEIIDVYNAITPLPRGYRMSYQDPWCAAFVSSCGAAAGLGKIIVAECSCDYMIAAYKRQGRYYEGKAKDARIGDLIFYNWNGDASCDHVGIVAERNGDLLKVIEGNKNDSVGYRQVSASWAAIQGFASPDYGEDAEDPAPPQEQAGTTTDGANWAPPTLRRGEKGISVLAMQAVLIARGFGCGPDGADGDFGPNTERGLRAFQLHYRLKETGVCEADTWKKLFGAA